MMKSATEHWLERIPLEEYSLQPYHISRYMFAAKYVEGKSILDIACGAGYGTRMLADFGTKNIIGMDLERSAIETSVFSEEDGQKKIFFSSASAIHIPLPDCSVDVIISMETIEHIEDVDGCLAEFRRVLSEDGLLILSTPNALVTKPCNGVPQNPFHVKEFEPDELAILLETYFSNVEFLGQRIREKLTEHSGDISQKSSTLLSRIIEIIPLEWRRNIPKMLPRKLADLIVVYFTGHHVTLQSDDIEIVSTMINTSPVIIALCRKNSFL